MRYVFNKIIFIITTLLIASLILYIGFSEGMIKFENNHIVIFKTEKISCTGSHNINDVCEVKLFNDSILKLKVGEDYIINKFDMTKVNIVNYGSMIILLIALIINHYLYNKEYKINN